MAIIELPDRLVTSDPKFFFSHIPKAGGMTFRDLLTRNCGERASVCEVNSQEGLSELIRNNPRSKIASLDLLMGHIPYCADMALLPARFQRLTILRRPADRVVSLFHAFQTQKSTTPIAKKIRETSMSLLDFVRDAEAPYWIHGHLSFLADSRMTPVDSDEHLALSLDHLFTDFVWFGTVERWDESLLLLQDSCGVDPSLYRRQNVQRAELRYEPSDEEREVLKVVLHRENRLYNIASQVLEERLKRVPDRAARLKKLREKVSSEVQYASTWEDEQIQAGAHVAT